MNVFVTRQIPEVGIKMLKQKKFNVIIAPQDSPISKSELLKGVKNADALLSILTDKIDKDVFEAGKNLKIVANYAVGFDNIDLNEASKRKVIVTNASAPEVSETVAEHTLALMFALAHRVVETDKFTREGCYKGWGPMMFLGSDVYKKTVGIIGLGAIGKALARRLKDGFDMKIIYNSRNNDEKFEKEYNATFVTLKTLLKKSDFVSLHVPLTNETRHLISYDELALMKKTAFLINTARGPVVDELALVKALTQNKIAGAGLDVFECEPLIDCNPNDTYELRNLKNVVLTPHTASASIEAREAMSVLACKNIIAVLSGKKALTPV